MRKLLWILTILIFVMACNDDEPLPTPTITTYQDPEPYGMPFQNTPEIEDIVMYEVNLRAFSPANFAGVESRLDSIKALGVNVIWLMPITPIGEERSVGQLGSPYSVKNYKEVNPEFGDMDDFRSFVDAAHDRDIAVITDWVANHTSWDNPWMNKTSWYTKDANGNVVHPPGTNWLDVADLNFENEAMRKEMIRAMKFWILTANIDGFRCDYADGVPFDFWRDAIDTLRAMEDRNLILLAEGVRNDHYSAGFDMTYAWDFYGKLKSIFENNENARNIFVTNSAEYGSIPDGKHKLRFTTNHDETAWDAPPTQIFGNAEGSIAAFVATTFLQGVPLIYTGQEVGVDVNMPFFSRYPVNWTMNPSIFQEYKDLMSVYTNAEVARTGSITTLVNNNNDIIGFKKVKNGDEMLFFINTRDNAVTYALPSSVQNTTWTNSMDNSNTLLNTDITLNAYEYLILEN
jgi:glycosidase